MSLGRPLCAETPRAVKAGSLDAPAFPQPPFVTLAPNTRDYFDIRRSRLPGSTVF